MADSSYYYDLYTEKRKKVRELEDNIEALKKILDNLTDDMHDEIRAINNEVDALKYDLKRAVRHNLKFTTRINALGKEKEKNVTADNRLKIALDELQDEISRLKRLKWETEQSQEDYYDKYKDAKNSDKGSGGGRGF